MDPEKRKIIEYVRNKYGIEPGLKYCHKLSNEEDLRNMANRLKGRFQKQKDICLNNIVHNICVIGDIPNWLSIVLEYKYIPVRNMDGHTPFYVACLLGRSKCVNYFIFNVPNCLETEEPFYFEIFFRIFLKCEIETFKHFIREKNFNVNVVDVDGANILHRLIISFIKKEIEWCGGLKFHIKEKLKYLLKNTNVDVNDVYDYGNLIKCGQTKHSILSILCFSYNIDVGECYRGLIRVITKYSKNLNYKMGFENNETVLHYIVKSGKEIFYYIYKNFIEQIVNEQDCFGNTALMWACKHEEVCMIEKLIYFGADKTIKNKDGFTARDMDSRGFMRFR